MSTTIYNIANWANSTNYVKNDIVSNGGSYYYALVSHVSDPSQTFAQTVAANPSLWGGVGTDPVSGQTKPQFIWTPSYQGSVVVNPRIKKIQYGDGYEQRLSDGINSILLELNLSFDTRTSQEATAILHFLHEKSGRKSFLYLPAAPFNSIKKFVARSWESVTNFYENYSIKCKFEEVPN